jgi:hypothetical protein
MAASSSEPLPVEYAAPPSCIDAATFRQHLESLPAARERGELPRTVTVHITESGGTFTGEVVVHHRDGSTSVRSIASARCDEVSDALEFITALAFGLEEPKARTAAPAPPPAPPAAVAPPPPKTEAPAPASAAPAGAGDPDHAAPRAPFRFVVSLRGALLSGASPNVELAPEAALGAVLDAPGVWAPSFELSATFASQDASTAVGTGTLTLVRGAAEACPVRLSLLGGPSGGLAVRPCLQVQAGTLSASGRGSAVLPGPTQVQPFVAIAPTVRVEWRLSGRFALEVEAGPSLALARDHFFFDPSGATVFDVPVVGSVTKLGASVFFP